MQQKHQRTYGAVWDGALYVGQLLSHFDVFLYLEYKANKGHDIFITILWHLAKGLVL